jgi:hypothetical protein
MLGPAAAILACRPALPPAHFGSGETEMRLGGAALGGEGLPRAARAWATRSRVKVAGFCMQ